MTWVLVELCETPRSWFFVWRCSRCRALAVSHMQEHVPSSCGKCHAVRA